MEVEKAFKKLLIQHPFYGLFCMGLPKEITTKIPTLAVAREGISCKLCINPQFWSTLSDTEQVAVLIHELSHIALKHMFMCKDFPDRELFNYAADVEVNSYIKGLPKGAITAKTLSERLHTHVIEGLGTKKYYELLKTTQEDDPNVSLSSQDAETDSSKDQSQQQEEEKKKEGQGGESSSTIGDHSTWKDFEDASEAEKQLITVNIDSIIKDTAEQVEKACGSIPGNLTELLEKLRTPNKPVFDWKSYFRRMLGTIYDINIKSSRKMPSKRFPDSSGVKHKKKVSILIAIDTSGSLDTKSLQEFFSEIDNVNKAGAKITLLQCDEEITSISEYNGVIPKIKGRGGTSFDPPIDYYIKNRSEYGTLIYFTDGYAPAPIKHPENVIWIITPGGSTQDFFGKVIRIPENNEKN